MTSPTLATHTLIAVDLPGYGGSDSLDNYGPGEVLEALAAFIIEMRAKYLGEGRKVVVVTHDWGTIVSSRLAGEAKGLADRWVLTSGIVVSSHSSRPRATERVTPIYTKLLCSHNTFAPTLLPV